MNYLFCRYCEEEFSNSKDLKKHEKNCDCNPANESKKYVCRNCKKSFSNKEDLKKHLSYCTNDEEF